MQVAVYARIGPDDRDHDPEPQIAALRRFAAAQGWLVIREYIDYTAAGLEPLIAWREMLDDAPKHCFQGVLVFNLKGAFRSAKHMYDTIMTLEVYQISFHSMTECFDTRTVAGRQTLQVVASLSGYEREVHRRRVHAGMTRARKQGKRIGRPPITSRPEVARLWPVVQERVRSGEISLGEAARILRIGKTTLRRLLAKTEDAGTANNDDARPPPAPHMCGALRLN